jgi:hypothetical protein
MTDPRTSREKPRRKRIEPLNGVRLSFSINAPVQTLIEILPRQQLTAVLRGLSEVMNAQKETCDD